MAWGFNPYLMSANQFTGAYLAVVESVAAWLPPASTTADVYLTFQEYFEKLGADPNRWGKPGCRAGRAHGPGRPRHRLHRRQGLHVRHLRGAGRAAHAGVLCHGRARSPRDLPEFKGAGHPVVAVVPEYEPTASRPRRSPSLAAFDAVEALVGSAPRWPSLRRATAASAEALFKMCVGNGLGLDVAPGYDADSLFCPAYGSFIVELDEAELPQVTGGLDGGSPWLTTEAYESLPPDRPLTWPSCRRPGRAPSSPSFRTARRAGRYREGQL